MSFVSTALILTLLGLSDSQVSFTGPGWYNLEFKEGQRLTLKVLDREEGSFRCYYQGADFQISKEQIKSLCRLTALKRDGKTEAKNALTPEEEEQVRDAVEQLNVMEDSGAEKAFEFLRKDFARCNKILTEALAHREARVRKLVVKLLGEEGKAEVDTAPLIPLLKDSDQRVRLAAVMALRNLGPSSLEAILDYLRWEPAANNRKMAVKNLARWHQPEAIEPLVGLLEEEKDSGVRTFIVNALMTLTRQDLGKDFEAWRAYLDDQTKTREIEQLKTEEGDSK